MHPTQYKKKLQELLVVKEKKISWRQGDWEAATRVKPSRVSVPLTSDAADLLRLH
jgi:hypothetical protein